MYGNGNAKVSPSFNTTIYPPYLLAFVDNVGISSHPARHNNITKKENLRYAYYSIFISSGSVAYGEILHLFSPLVS